MIVLCDGIKKINNELERTGTNSGGVSSYGVRMSSLLIFIPVHRDKWQSSAIPVTTYEKATASRFRTRMTRIFADVVDSCASLFHSPDNKPQRSQRTQSRIANLCALLVLCGRLTLFTAWLTRIYTYPRVSAQSVFHRRL